MLQRIVVMLLSLADLADHAAGRSPATRRRVMWVLWQANAVVTDFVTASACPTGSHLKAGEIRQGDDPADAKSLAVSLRWLALIVHGMADEERRLSHSRPSSASHKDGHANLILIQSLRAAAASLPEIRDTS